MIEVYLTSYNHRDIVIDKIIYFINFFDDIDCTYYYRNFNSSVNKMEFENEDCEHKFNKDAPFVKSLLFMEL